MLYCGTCALTMGWPRSQTRKRGQCELCGNTGSCNDAPASQLNCITVKTIALVTVHPAEQENFTIDGRQYLRVVKILKRVQIGAVGESVTLEYIRDNNLNDPAADPLIIGTIQTKIVDEHGTRSDYRPRVLWNERLWRTLDEDTEAIYEMLTGVKAADVKQFAEQLRQRSVLPFGEGSGLRLYPPSEGGTHKESPR
jgi:hypothetical protein